MLQMLRVSKCVVAGKLYTVSHAIVCVRLVIKFVVETTTSSN